MIPFPDKKYDIIYADPCWKHLSDKGVYSPRDDIFFSTLDHYDTMSFQELSDLPVQSIANDNCLLFMWVLNCDFIKCVDVGKAWGFSYSTVAFIWYKENQLMGNYTMPQCEQCVVMKKGRIPEPRGKRNIKQFLSCKRGRHSEKPKEIRHRITEMFPTQSKIELFARPDWTDYGRGWDFWGNEVN